MISQRPVTFIRDIVIAFVTRSDPTSSRGAANAITVIKAKIPQVVYLLYTKATAKNRESLLDQIQREGDLGGVTFDDRPPLDLPDVTDYGRLSDLLIGELDDIFDRHPGAHFHLVSGLAQARLVFALYLYARQRSTLYEVLDPKATDPNQPLDRSECISRLKPWPTGMFLRFYEMQRQQSLRPRLVFTFEPPAASLDGHRLGFRQYKGERRTFWLLVLLALRKVWGPGGTPENESLPREALRKHLYSAVSEPEKQIPEAVDRVNHLAKAAFKASNRPRKAFAKLIEAVNGMYRITEELGAGRQVIDFQETDQMRQELKTILDSPSGDKMRNLFPQLPP